MIIFDEYLKFIIILIYFILEIHQFLVSFKTFKTLPCTMLKDTIINQNGTLIILSSLLKNISKIGSSLFIFRYLDLL